jgi:serine/threonine protein phosphatase PrpC
MSALVMDKPETQTASLFVDADMAEGLVLPFAGGQAVVFSARSPDKPPPNEDAVALLPYDERSGALVIADGMGGTPAGQQASATALAVLKESVAAAALDEVALRVAILNGIEEANHQIARLGVGAGTTLAVVEIQDGAARAYHVGDSMILVTGQRGRVKLRTISHSPVGYAVEAGFLDEVEAMHHDDRHLVCNMLGSAEMRVEIGSSLNLASRDTLVLASDGLFDNLHVDEIVERIRKGPLPRVAASLAADCRRRMTQPQAGEPSKPDDLTFIVYRRN